MPQIKLKPFPIDGCDIFINTADIRRNLHAFLDYVQEHDIVRTYRDNYLPKNDVKRMAKTCVAPEDVAEIKAAGDSCWIDLLDELALGLKLISYKTKGQLWAITATPNRTRTTLSR